MSNKIDFVITWVDPSDKKWIIEKNKYKPDEKMVDVRNNRYRDWDCLKYLFRGIEKFAPWVNKVFFVTCGQKPDWLNVNNNKIVCVNHEEFMPRECLPTFNSSAILVNLHRIKELSENFVLFDDDMFITKEVSPDDFFYKNLPCDSAILSPIISFDKDGFPKMLQNNMAIINMHFDKKDVIRKNISQWINPKYRTYGIRSLCMLPWRHFVGFWEPHIPNSIKKETMRKVWKLEKEVLVQTSRSRFRDNNTNVNQWLFRYWNIASGKFYPRDVNFGRKFQYGIDSHIMYSAIRNHKYKTVCLNDIEGDYDFSAEKSKTIKAFNSILPKKSSFEI